MADWVHCNRCMDRPKKSGDRFMLTSCGHIYCNNCSVTGIQPHCKMCGATCNTIPLSPKMKPEVQQYFTEPSDLIKQQQKQLAQILQVMEFQKNHRQRLMAYQMDKMGKLNRVMEEGKKAVETCRDLEREVRILREENSYFKKLVNTTRTRQSPGRSHGPGQVSPQRGSPSQHTRVSPQRSQSACHNGYDSSPSALMRSQSSNTPKGPDRLLVRTPPSGGKMGTIRRTPSPHQAMTRGSITSTPTSSRPPLSPMNTSPWQPKTPGGGVLQCPPTHLPMTPNVQKASSQPVPGQITPQNQRNIQNLIQLPTTVSGGLNRHLYPRS